MWTRQRRMLLGAALLVVGMILASWLIQRPIYTDLPTDLQELFRPPQAEMWCGTVLDPFSAGRIADPDRAPVESRAAVITARDGLQHKCDDARRWRIAEALAGLVVATIGAAVLVVAFRHAQTETGDDTDGATVSTAISAPADARQGALEDGQSKNDWSSLPAREDENPLRP